MIFVYITNPSKEKAAEIARHLLGKRLVACANIFPIESMYWWEGKITDDNESVLIAKTVEENFERIKKEVEKMHPYSVPCVLKINAEANEKYAEWVGKELKG